MLPLLVKVKGDLQPERVTLGPQLSYKHGENFLVKSKVEVVGSVAQVVETLYRQCGVEY